MIRTNITTIRTTARTIAIINTGSIPEEELGDNWIMGL